MHPFLQFPNLAFLSFLLVPVLLRAVAALSIAYIAYVHFVRRSESPFGAVIWVTILVEAAIALCLLAGYYTQYAALLGVLLSIKHFVFAKRYSRMVPLCRVDYVYLFVICLSLVITGGGAFALDIPL
jgi:uncharacterized membrane protein YphA (DoxX/SURF4 family)